MVNTTNPKEKNTVYLGIALIVLGLVLNQWVIEWLFVSDGVLRNQLYINVIRIFQVVLVVAGAVIAIRKPTLPQVKKADLAMAIAGILFPLLLLEVGVRVWLGFVATPSQYNQYSLYTNIAPIDFQWSPHPNLNHYPTPNYVKGLTTHNSLGYRGEEIGVKNAGTFRIVAIGGSTTYTVRVEDDNLTYPAQLERILNEEYGYNVEVINAGVADYNSWDSLINLSIRVLDLDPDLIIIYHGTNDVHARLVEPSAYRPDDSGRRKQWTPPAIPLWQHSALLRVTTRLIGWSDQVVLGDFVNADTYIGWPSFGGNQYSDADLLEVLAQNPPIYFERNLESMIAIARAQDVDVMLATWAYSPEMGDYASTDVYLQGFDENNVVVRKVAMEQGVPLFDFVAVMPQDPKYWADGRHVNEDGALLKAALFADFIDSERLIRK
jgi:lysophospholipase L1-like esterase